MKKLRHCKTVRSITFIAIWINLRLLNKRLFPIYQTREWIGWD